MYDNTPLQKAFVNHCVHRQHQETAKLQAEKNEQTDGQTDKWR